MSTHPFAYGPSITIWAKEINNLIGGEGDTIRSCTEKMKSQMEQLTQPDVWTGSAAVQNFSNFMQTENALISFANEFGEKFTSAVKNTNDAVEQLELGNLAQNTNISGIMDSLSFNQLSAMAEANINKETVLYNYNVIAQIGTELATIQTQLETINSSLLAKINQLDDGSAMWDGNSAESARESLSGVLNTNMPKIFENLNICIRNISAAAEAAKVADSAQ